MAAGVSYLVAFGGGVASFASPCVLPLVPGYLSVVTGLDLAGLSAAQGPRPVGRVVRDTGLFVGGFGAVFVALGVSASALGHALFRNQELLTRVSGGVVLAMAALLLLSLVAPVPLFGREARFHPRLASLGPLAAPVAGAAFGFGWTPCIGPILASVLALAATQAGAASGAVLLALYAAGLGLPFLLVGLAFGGATRALAVVRRHSRSLSVLSASVLAGFGVLLVLDRLAWLTVELESTLHAMGLGGLAHLG